MSSDELVLIGKVTATHGIKGELRISLFSGDADTLLSVDTVLLKQPGREAKAFDVLSSRLHGKKVLLALKPFSNINEVLALVGSELYVHRFQLPELESDEYYWRDLIGMQVVTSTEEDLGQLIEILATGSNDVFVVKGVRGELLIPAIEDVVLEIDHQQRVVRVDLPEGLLDI